jgi:chaperone modulatory protein CbpM
MQYHEFLVRARLEDNVLKDWVAAGWLIPTDHAGETQFSDADLARAHLINDLKGDIGVNDEGVAVILHLLDQLHGLRKTFGEFLSAVETGPDGLREKLVLHLCETPPIYRTGPIP